jgi:hypothetical protein
MMKRHAKMQVIQRGTLSEEREVNERGSHNVVVIE